MRAAKRQAEDYARALPKEHGWPPFILVVDVGHVIEVYADFSGQGKNYAQFPDRDGYSIPLEGLRDQAIRDRLRAIWCAPHSLDPAKRSAEVTRDIAARLARIARSLEGKHDAKEVAEFLMRCLFTMFAEDVGLLPKQGFEKLLGEMVDTPQHFAPALESLWRVMDEGGYAPHLNATIKRFNGTLFRKRKAIALEKDDIRELHIAAGRDWRDVEPAIFGTLLERALDKRERSKLGAHYTPRAYVERLVVPTIIEPLRADWEEALTRAHALEGEGKHQAALQAIKAFHHRLCTGPRAGPGLRHRQLPLRLAGADEAAGRRGAGRAGPPWRTGFGAALGDGGRDGQPAPIPRSGNQPARCRHRRSRPLDRLPQVAAPYRQGPTRSRNRCSTLTARLRSRTRSWPGTSRNCSATSTACRSPAGMVQP